MNDKMMVVIFDDEKKAYEGIKALKDLHAEGSITLYASAVIAKEADGKLTVKAGGRAAARSGRAWACSLGV